METVSVIHTDENGVVTNTNRTARMRFSAAPGRKCVDVVALRDASGRPICTERCAAALASQGEGGREAHGSSRGAHVRVECIAMGKGTTVLIHPDAEPVAVSPLSPREQEILGMVAEGLTARRIARRLGIKESTVRTHLDHAKEKLGARSLPEAVSRLGK